MPNGDSVTTTDGSISTGTFSTAGAAGMPGLQIPPAEKPTLPNAETGGQTAEQDRLFTQQDLNRILGERLARERAQFADYDVLKDAAGRWAAHEATLKTETEKTQELLQRLQTERDQALATANERLIRAAFIAEASKAGALYPEDVFALADKATVKVDQKGNVTGVTEAVASVVSTGRVPLQASQTQRVPAAKLDGGAGSASRAGEKDAALSDEEIAVAKRLGISAEVYAQRRKELKATQS